MKIKLSESKLRQIVKESIINIINEGGHLTGTYDDGSRWTNSKDMWRGVEGTTYIWHGEWSDPEVWYDGEELNGNQLDEFAWDVYKTECEENDKEVDENEFDNLPSEWFKNILDDFMFGMFADQH